MVRDHGGDRGHERHSQSVSADADRSKLAIAFGLIVVFMAFEVASARKSCPHSSTARACSSSGCSSSTSATAGQPAEVTGTAVLVVALVGIVAAHRGYSGGLPGPGQRSPTRGHQC